MKHGARRTALFSVLGAFLSLAAVLALWKDTGREEIYGPTPSLTAEPRSEPMKAVAPASSETAPVAAESSPTPASPPARTQLPRAPVVLYEHPTHHAAFPGLRWELALGTTNAGVAFPNNDVSAVEVPAGLQVTLFNSPNAKGARVVLGPGRHNLAPYRFDDRLSSARVTALGEDADSPAGPADRVVLYESSEVTHGERGLAWPLEFPSDRSNQLFSSANADFDGFATSSAWVPVGYELTLFVEPDGRGAATVLGPGLHELALVGFNDRAQSARVRRTTKR